MKRLAYVLLCVLAHWSIATAQDWRSALEKASKPYLDKHYEILFRYEVFEEGQNKALETQDMWAVMDGDRYRARYMGMDVIGNDKYAVTVIEDMRKVSITSMRPQKELTVDELEKNNLLPKEGVAFFEAMLQNFKDNAAMNSESTKTKENFKVDYTKKSGQRYVYTFHLDEGVYDKAELYFEGDLFKKMVCSVRNPMEVAPSVFKKVKLVMSVDKQVFGKDINNAQIDGHDVFSVDPSGRISLNEKYKDYEIIR